jgi:hypothetical protein
MVKTVQGSSLSLTPAVHAAENSVKISFFLMAERKQPASDIPTYRSGAVARLTGIPVETLRVWERRHNVVGPLQSATGQRLYSPEAVTRLTVIKQLVDSGYAIGSISALDLEQLRSMLRCAAPLSTLRL